MASNELETLRLSVAALKDKLKRLVEDSPRATLSKKTVPRIDGTSPMNDQVTAENPYSRLMALKKMGIVENFEEIRNKTVVICGIGGIGAVAADMLVRCGVGKLILFDNDKVEMANMNRLFFRPDQVGLSKTEAAKDTLSSINPDVEFEQYDYDISGIDNFDHLKDRFFHGGIDSESKVDLVLSCVDNYTARMVINQACTELDVVWMESGVSETAMSGHIQLMLPGRTSCYMCAPPLLVQTGIDESTLKREGVCAASLPTTMSIIAGLLVQNSLKYLLDFGLVSYYLGYDSMSNYFPAQIVYPNLECSLLACVEKQQEYAGWQPIFSLPESDEVSVIHETNEWDIEVIENNTYYDNNYQYDYQEEYVQAGDNTAGEASLDDLKQQLSEQFEPNPEEEELL